jgi:hypothetical protein
MPGASIPPKAMASSPTSVSKVATTVSSPRAGVLKISARKKRPVAALSLVTKGKQAMLEVGPPLTSAALSRFLPGRGSRQG